MWVFEVTVLLDRTLINSFTMLDLGCEVFVPLACLSGVVEISVCSPRRSHIRN